MIFFGVNIPSFAVAVGSIIGAFLIGFGAGIGSKLAEYYAKKYLIRKIDHIHKRTFKIIKKIYKR